MKLKFIRNWRQCLFKRFRSFIVKLELKNWKKYFQNTTIKFLHTPAFKPKFFVEGVKINNEAK
jgi:hypothetical protein